MLEYVVVFAALMIMVSFVANKFVATQSVSGTIRANGGVNITQTIGKRTSRGVWPFTRNTITCSMSNSVVGKGCVIVQDTPNGELRVEKDAIYINNVRQWGVPSTFSSITHKEDELVVDGITYCIER